MDGLLGTGVEWSLQMLSRELDIRRNRTHAVWVFIPLALCAEPCNGHYSVSLPKATALLRGGDGGHFCQFLVILVTLTIGLVAMMAPYHY